ncbi:MAG TPA: amidohydrolase family protein, partial [Mycobacteriales bacterium]|nr:amidohydrolase family protein [Mycobacteriales bacterium]
MTAPAPSRESRAATTIHLAPVVLPMTGEEIRDGGVAIAAGHVTAVGVRAELLRDNPAARVREWPGVMTPGLVNAHTHLEYGPPFADLAVSGLPFASWIGSLSERRRAMSPADWLAAARGSVAALLRSGTTCIGDVVTVGPGIAAAARASLAGISYVEAVGADDAGGAAELARVSAVIRGAPPGRVLGISPHALYSLSAGVFRELVALARTHRMRLHTHLAESAEEAEYVAAGLGAIADQLRRLSFDHDLLGCGSGVSPAAHLAALGGLGGDVHVAHGVHLDEADRALLRRHGTAVALCVRSNRTLGAGDPPVAAHLAEGSPICVGTDSLASSPSLDLVAELAALRDLAVDQGAARDDLERRLVEAATVGGAAALGLAGQAGVLAPGCRADLAVYD